jgi:hypothetical protein
MAEVTMKTISTGSEDSRGAVPELRDDQFTPYVFPRRVRGKEDVRWLALTDAQGVGLMVIALDKLHRCLALYDQGSGECQAPL